MEFDLMSNEYSAWEATNEELDRLGLSWNDQTGLHTAVMLWAERLGALRMTQDDEMRAKALTDAESRRYPLVR